MRIILIINIVFCIVSCSKDKTNAIGYDPNFTNLVDHDTIFIGEWKTANQGEEFYLYFDIMMNSESHYISDYKSDVHPPTEINRIAKYNNGHIYLEDKKKMNVDQHPQFSNDTVEQYSSNGPIKYVYSAVMTIDNHVLYRVEEVIE
tara:strand:+ start:58629 stop:59066 length:438 start_codon:yes stop_codon:yes gene_type:complete